MYDEKLKDINGKNNYYIQRDLDKIVSAKQA